MPDYERTETVEAEADAHFDYLSDVGNLPSYFSGMTSARRADGDAVHTTARVDMGDGPQEVEGEAWFRVHQEDLRLEWGSEGPNDYHGELEVTARDGGSEVAVRLHTERADASAEIEQGLEETVRDIKRIVEDGATGPGAGTDTP